MFKTRCRLCHNTGVIQLALPSRWCPRTRGENALPKWVGFMSTSVMTLSKSRNKLCSSTARSAQFSAAPLVLTPVILFHSTVANQDEWLLNIADFFFFFLIPLCPSHLISHTHNTNFLLLSLPLWITCLVLFCCSSILHSYSLSPKQYSLTTSALYVKVSYISLTLQ